MHRAAGWKALVGALVVTLMPVGGIAMAADASAATSAEPRHAGDEIVGALTTTLSLVSGSPQVGDPLTTTLTVGARETFAGLKVHLEGSGTADLDSQADITVAAPAPGDTRVLSVGFHVTGDGDGAVLAKVTALDGSGAIAATDGATLFVAGAGGAVVQSQSGTLDLHLQQLAQRRASMSDAEYQAAVEALRGGGA